MANDEHLSVLRRGVEAWNKWREANPQTEPDLTGADLTQASLARADLIEAYLAGANLGEANLIKANLFEANLIGADLIGADFTAANLARTYLTGANGARANLTEANLSKATLTKANFSRANFSRANLSRASLAQADLTRANLIGANLTGADLSNAGLVEACLIGANLAEANLSGANVSRANLAEADLSRALLVNANFERALINGCRVHGVYSWNIRLEAAEQLGLVITDRDQPAIAVDDLQLALFIRALLDSSHMRDVVDFAAQKIVLVLGCFTRGRKKVLEAIANELRDKHDRYPVIVDFENPSSHEFMQTVATLARVSRFVVADFTDARFALEQAREIVGSISAPVVPLLRRGELGSTVRPPMALYSLRSSHQSLLETHWYSDIDDLRATLESKVIVPAENRLVGIQKKRAQDLLQSLDVR